MNFFVFLFHCPLIQFSVVPNQAPFHYLTKIVQTLFVVCFLFFPQKFSSQAITEENMPNMYNIILAPVVRKLDDAIQQINLTHWVMEYWFP